MNDPKTEAGRRPNDPVELEETISPKDRKDDKPPTPETPPKSEMDEAAAESAPELRDIRVNGKIDRPDGKN